MQSGENVTPWPEVRYSVNKNGDAIRYAEDLGLLVLPSRHGPEFAVLEDVLMGEEARRLKKVFSFTLGKVLQRGGVVWASQVDSFAKLYENEEPLE
jgi:hypothetical protein